MYMYVCVWFSNNVEVEKEGFSPPLLSFCLVLPSHFVLFIQTVARDCLNSYM